MKDKKAFVPTPLRMKRVLVALDANDESRHAARTGLELAVRFGARTEFVHAIDSFTPPTPGAVARGEDLMTATRERVIRLVNRAAEAPRGVALDTQERVHVTVGKPAAVILERARAMTADLIVLGKLRSRKAIEFGSTARAVLAKAPCAVWAQPGAPSAIKRILVPFDFSHESEIALATAIEFACSFGAKVTAFHCLEPVLYGDDPLGVLGGIATLSELEHGRTAEFRRELERVDWRSVDHDDLFTTGMPADRIVELLPDYDLVVMGTHGRTGLAAAVMGSVAYSVLKRATIPVLAVRQTDRTFRLS